MSRIVPLTPQAQLWRQRPRSAEGSLPRNFSCSPPKSLPSNVKQFKGLNLGSGVSHVFVEWAWSFLGICSRAPVCLAAFIAKSLQPMPCHAYKPAASGDIWPVAPASVASVGHLQTGSQAAAPCTSSCLGRRLNSRQWSVVRRLEKMLDAWLIHPLATSESENRGARHCAWST